MKNQGIKYGIIAGVLSSVLSLLIYFIDYSMFATLWLLLVFVIIGVVIAVIAVRKEKSVQGGLLDFKGAFITSFTCFLVAGVIGTLFSILLFSVIDSELGAKVADKIMENTVALMEKFGAPVDAIDESMKEMENLEDDFTAKGQALSFFKNLIVYVILSLIIGAIMKSKSDELIMAEKTVE
jgi:hypothetical protein